MAETTLDTTQDRVACAYCGAPCDTHLCSACRRIQPVASGTDFFTFLGLPRRLGLDETRLEQLFYSLSRKFHPDYFACASPAEQQASMERSSMLNDAYRTLRDKVARAQYLLSLEGYRDGGKKAPPDLLEEIFELNMRIEELKSAKQIADDDEITEARAALEDALAGLRDKLSAIDRRLAGLFEEWDALFEREGASGEKKLVLDRMSELLSHRSYIRNLVREIKEEL